MQSLIRHVGRALAAWHRGRNHEAIREFRRATKAQPNQVELWVVLGDLEQGEELYAAATRSYRRALALMGSGRARRFPSLPGRQGPTEATTRRSLGSVLGQSGKMNEAEVEFRRALALKPDAVAHVCIGEVCELTGRVREARACFVRALRLDRDCVEARYRLGSIHMWTAPQRAERLLRQVARRDPGHAMALSALGLLLGMRGAFDEADELLGRAARAGGAGALPHVYRGHHLLHQGQPGEAMEAYESALVAAPGDPHPFFAIGDLHRQEGRDAEARVAYENALRLDPRCGDAALRLGYLNEEEGHPAEAVRCYERGLALAPQHPWADDVRHAIHRCTDNGPREPTDRSQPRSDR